MRGLIRRGEGRGAETIRGERISRRLSQALDVALGYQAIGYKDTRYARFASFSHPLVGRDLLELRREHVFGRFEIEAMRIPFSLSVL